MSKHQTRVFSQNVPYIPMDCQMIIQEFLPHSVSERCYMCGFGIIMKDKRGREHFHAHIVCTESVFLCEECFEMFYE